MEKSMSKSNVKHTPTTPPWRLERLSGGGHCNIGIRVFGGLVSGYAAFVNTRWPNEDQAAEQEANAAFIVRAVNAHYDMLGLLEEAARYLRHDPQTDLELVGRIESTAAELRGEA
jgi:hypothetical protein